MPAPPLSFHDEPRMMDWLDRHGGARFYPDLRRALFREGTPWEEALATLPPALEAALRREATWSSLRLVHVRWASDRSTKAVFQTHDGFAVEAVLMRHRQRATLCLSCQVGCALGCTFCSTGNLGLTRSLTTAEILEQASWAVEVLRTEGQRLRNVVFMGMGEPLLCLDAVGPALGGLTDQKRFEIAPRYLSLSTCGVTPSIGRFARAHPRLKLAVSLHAPRQDLRDRLMPGCRGWPLQGLLAALDDYATTTGHQLFFEYIMMAGVNDGVREAEELANLLKGRRAHVNLIPYNAAAGDGKASGRDVLDRFQALLGEAGTTSTVRHSAGEAIAAACGQLAGKEPSGKSSGSASPTVEANRN